MKPDDDFAMTWEVDDRAQKRIKDIADALKRRRQADPGHRPRPRGRGDLLARAARCSTRRTRSKGKQDRARRVQRGDQGRGARSHRASARRSTQNWSTPISRAARSTISSASRCRRFCGASCRARARPAACNPSRCASSSSASRRSKPSRRKNTGPSTPICAPRRETSPRVSRISTARSSTSSRSRTRPTPTAPSPRSMRARFKVDSVESKPVKRNPSPPFITSTLQQEASRKLGFAAKRTMQIAQGLYEGVEHRRRYGRPHHLYAYRRHHDGRRSDHRSARHDRQALWRPLRAVGTPRLHQQGQERAGSPRGHPPDQLRPHAGRDREFTR